MQKCVSQIVHVLLPIEEAKLDNCSTINHDNAQSCRCMALVSS